MKKYIDISSYSPFGLLEELSESVHGGKTNITCVDKEKRRMSFIHKMSFKDIVEAAFDESDRFEFYYEESSDGEESEGQDNSEQRE